MNVLNFAFIKINSERIKNFNLPFSTNTNLQFEDIEKEKTEISKDKEIFSLRFSCTITYTLSQNEKKEVKPSKDEKEVKQAEIYLEGIIVLSLEKEESKELQKAWKKKEVPENLKEPIFNVILRKCTVKALTIEDELGIPPHLSLPRLKFQQQ